MEQLLRRCTREYVLNSSPRRLCKQLAMINQVEDTEDVSVEIEEWVSAEVDNPHHNKYLVTIASPNVAPAAKIRKTVLYLKSRGPVIAGESHTRLCGWRSVVDARPRPRGSTRLQTFWSRTPLCTSGK